MRWRESKTVQVKTTLLSIAIKGRKKKNVTSEKMQCQERDFFFVLGSVLWFFFLNTWNLFLSIALSYPSSVCFMPHVAGILDL